MDADGNEYDTTGRAVIARCRCGGSTTKPLYDGPLTHRLPSRRQEGRLPRTVGIAVSNRVQDERS